MTPTLPPVRFFQGTGVPTLHQRLQYLEDILRAHDAWERRRLRVWVWVLALGVLADTLFTMLQADLINRRAEVVRAQTLDLAQHTLTNTARLRALSEEHRANVDRIEALRARVEVLDILTRTHDHRSRRSRPRRP